MNILIPETGIVKEQNINIQKDVSIIYGYNNSGKTTFLKVLNKVFYNRLMESYLSDTESEISVFIPTNRVIISEVATEHQVFKDLEEFINDQKDAYSDYGLHLKKIRDYLLKTGWVSDFICKAVKAIFDIDIDDLTVKYSDGIENIINIYLNILWVITWNADVAALDRKQLDRLVLKKGVYVLIDEIEMFLHVNVQAKLINRLKDDFKECSFILTTHSPLLLTRYRKTDVYNMIAGKLIPITEEFYYQDLDAVYEELFFVEELPPQLKEDINYLGEVVLRRIPCDLGRVNSIVNTLEKEYPNIHRKYIKIITKAQYIGECDGKN